MSGNKRKKNIYILKKMHKGKFAILFGLIIFKREKEWLMRKPVLITSVVVLETTF